MNKKEIIVSILVVGLTVLFAAVTLAVFLTKGKSKKWIAHKMKLGGLLLTLTAVSCNGGGEEAMCYSTVATNSFSMHSNSENGIEINLDTNNILKGSIYECINSEFSFSITDKNNNKIQAGNLISDDGEFNDLDESFTIELDENLKVGNYSLNLFTTGLSGQDTISPQNYYKLAIKAKR